MSVIELTKFTVRAENTQAMLDARPGMLEAFRQDRRGFIAARLVRVADDTWLDFVEWIDDTAWEVEGERGQPARDRRVLRHDRHSGEL
jgi:hypothetical protein